MLFRSSVGRFSKDAVDCEESISASAMAMVMLYKNDRSTVKETMPALLCY